MFNRIRASAVGSDEHQQLNVFGQRPVERMVRDDVSFAPIRNPYEALQQAAERFSEGKGVFSNAPTQKKSLDQKSD